MQQYDTTLKALFLDSKPTAILQELTGTAVEQWVVTELPQVRNLRVDLLAETTQGDLVHLEFQRANSREFAFRMLEYFVAITRVHGRAPHQIALYIGPEPMNIPSAYRWHGGSAEFTLVDARTLDGQHLLESPQLGDNVLSILARLDDEPGAVRRIVDRISQLEPDKSAEYGRMLLNLAGLRGLEEVTQKELNRAMALDLQELIPENRVLGPVYKQGVEEGIKEGLRAGIQEGIQKGIQKGIQEGIQKGIQEGIQKGKREGIQKGIREGEQAVICRLIEHRFGQLSAEALERLDSLTKPELDALSVRVLDAQSLEDLFR